MVIDVAGRQRMLAQRMSKNTCPVASGFNVETAQTELATASEICDASLKALYFGMPDVGISGPPSSMIKKNSGNILTRWQDLQPLLQTAIETSALDTEQLEIMFTGANALTGEMNTVDGMYSDASKLGL